MHKEKIRAALTRAWHTVWQAFVGCLTGVGIFELDIKYAISIALSAGLASLIKSLIIGTPETDASQPAELTEDEAMELICESSELMDEFVYDCDETEEEDE